MGNDPRVMSPQFAKPYVKSGKNDANDAEAICEAVAGLTAFRSGKEHRATDHASPEHRIYVPGSSRRGTALGNEIRGLLGRVREAHHACSVSDPNRATLMHVNMPSYLDNGLDSICC